MPSTLDLTRTLGVYRRRIESLPIGVFRRLDGHFLSTYDIYCTIHADPATHAVEVPVGMPQYTAFIIADVALDKGVRVRGVTGARVGSAHPSVYVGARNYFTGHPASVWSLQPIDKVYDTDACLPEDV